MNNYAYYIYGAGHYTEEDCRREDISPTFSEALRIDTRAGSWIFISGQVGVPLPPGKGSVTFEQEVRTTFERIRDSLGKL